MPRGSWATEPPNGQNMECVCWHHSSLVILRHNKTSTLQLASQMISSSYILTSEVQFTWNPLIFIAHLGTAPMFLDIGPVGLTGNYGPQFLASMKYTNLMFNSLLFSINLNFSPYPDVRLPWSPIMSLILFDNLFRLNWRFKSETIILTRFVFHFNS